MFALLLEMLRCVPEEAALTAWLWFNAHLDYLYEVRQLEAYRISTAFSIIQIFVRWCVSDEHPSDYLQGPFLASLRIFRTIPSMPTNTGARQGIGEAACQRTNAISDTKASDVPALY